MFTNSPKIEYLSEQQIKQTQCVKQEALEYDYLGCSKFRDFDPKIFRKQLLCKLKIKCKPYSN